MFSIKDKTISKKQLDIYDKYRYVHILLSINACTYTGMFVFYIPTPFVLPGNES